MSDSPGSVAIDQQAQLNRTIHLSDGRELGYVEYGAADGKPLFYFHGYPGSRLESRFLASASEAAGTRLIGIDRPGMGLSTFKPGRTVLDWPDDVLALADTLRLESFAVVAFSGGGPYAAACACKIPQRLTACGIIAGVGRISGYQAFLARWMPNLLTRTIERSLQTREKAHRMLARQSERWVEPDRKSLLKPGVSNILVDSLMDAFHQGSRGVAYEGTLFGHPSGFQLEEIAFPAVYLWHGGLDQEVSIDAGREVARRIPQCKATFYPDEGHISLIVNHAEEVVSALAGQAV
jgi:pimeloyl-ACP methyl ester carboxylesterase